MDGSSLSNIAQLDEFYRYQTAARPHRCLSERLVPPLARADLRRARVVNSVIAASPLAKAPPSTAVLWICIGLFFARVVGQLEVFLLAPPWLPPMQAWYSGLLSS
jgi:hypothetical protein